MISHMEIMKQGQINCHVKPIRTTEYPLPAKRPEYSVMDKTKIKRTFEIQIPYWKDSLTVAFQNLKKNRGNLSVPLIIQETWKTKIC